MSQNVPSHIVHTHNKHTQHKKGHGQKLDPFWLTGKWEGEGTRMEGDQEITFKETADFKVISTEPETVMNYQQVLNDTMNVNKCTAESGFWRICPQVQMPTVDMPQLPAIEGGDLLGQVKEMQALMPEMK